MMSRVGTKMMSRADEQSEQSEQMSGVSRDEQSRSFHIFPAACDGCQCIPTTRGPDDEDGVGGDDDDNDGDGDDDGNGVDDDSRITLLALSWLRNSIWTQMRRQVCASPRQIK